MGVLSSEEELHIVDRLEQRTQTGQLVWESFEDGVEYKARTTNFIYFIRTTQETDALPIYLQIWKDLDEPERKAVMITEIEVMPWNSIDLTHKTLALFKAAKRKALGVDTLAEDVLKDLT